MTADEIGRKYSGKVASVVPEVQSTLQRNLLSEFGEQIALTESHAWEYGLSVVMKKEGTRSRFRVLRDNPLFQFNMLLDVTVVDWLDLREPRFDVVYQLLSLKHRHRLCVLISVGEEKPEVESVRELWASANFMEREAWDMYGVEFAGHGDLRRILLYDEFVGHPLRKDYPLRGKQPRVQMRVPELRNTSADMTREPLVSLPTRRTLPREERHG